MAGIKEKMVDTDIIEGASLRDLLNKLTENYGNRFGEVVIDT